MDAKRIEELDQLLKISKTVEDMKPRSRHQRMHDWILEQLRHFNVFNSKFERKKIMEKSNEMMGKTEVLMFTEPIGRIYQV